MPHHRGCQLENWYVDYDYIDEGSDSVWWGECCVPLHEECRQYHGHKRDPGVTPEICGANGEGAQVILVWDCLSALGKPLTHGDLESRGVRP
jgi:hypothetical protein